MADNAPGVMVTGDDFDKVTTAKKNPNYYYWKTQEMLFDPNQTSRKIRLTANSNPYYKNSIFKIEQGVP